MTRRHIVYLVLHGVILVFLGMIAGYIYRFAITDDWGPDQQRTWRILHTFMVQTGSLYIAIAAIGHYLTMSARAGAFTMWSLSVGAYAFAAGLVVAAIVGTRGVEPGDSVVKVLIFCNFGASSALGLAGVAVVLRGAAVTVRRAASARVRAG